MAKSKPAPRPAGKQSGEPFAAWLQREAAGRVYSRAWKSLPPAALRELEQTREHNHTPGRRPIGTRRMVERLAEAYGVSLSVSGLQTWARDTGKPWQA